MHEKVQKTILCDVTKETLIKMSYFIEKEPEMVIETF
jgi:hypothetical protein